ncbi:helix-turn-helix domain-containing protein [Actinomadura fulvescens]|uniref:helix-turn-helix domain-containing protein n=1 Tax=Actinomadura fulvescens TaxID=46160 RepID=UPI0031CEACEE
MREDFLALRPLTPGIAAEVVQAIERELPDYARPQDERRTNALATAVDWTIGHFIDLAINPALPSDAILRFYRDVGVSEAREGRSLDTWHAAMRIGAGAALQRLLEASEKLKQGLTASVIARITQAMFGYIDQLAAAATAGHSDPRARAYGDLQAARHQLIDLLTSKEPSSPAAIQEAAAAASWTVPRSAAAVALLGRSSEARRPVLASDILTAFHLPAPFLIVPDPGSPARRRQLEAGLRQWHAAIGPTVPISEIAASLTWARQTLDLLAQGLLTSNTSIATEDHIPLILIGTNRDLVIRAASRRLAPLMDLRPQQRYRLAETLLASLECDFNTTEVARRLQIHAQTVRYRQRQLQELLGDLRHDPGRRLELHLLVTAWLTTTPSPPST